jgi:hypothetical protein
VGVDFIGFLVGESADVTASRLSALSLDPPLQQALPVGPRMALLLAAPPHELPDDSSRHEAIATTLAAAFGPCLVVYNADTVGLRVAELFGASGFLGAFGELDEIWVPVAESGFADTKGQRLTATDVADEDEDRRYACIFDGIDAGVLRMTGRREVTADSLAHVVLNAVARSDSEP